MPSDVNEGLVASVTSAVLEVSMITSLTRTWQAASKLVDPVQSGTFIDFGLVSIV